MKKNSFWIVLIFIFTFFGAVSGADKAEYGFKKAKWGMTMDEVKKSEKGKPTGGNVSIYCVSNWGNCLVYDDKFAGIKGKTFYSFGKKGLAMAGYYFDYDKIESDKPEQSYVVLKKKLTALLGGPVYHPVTGENEKEQDGPQVVYIKTAYFKTGTSFISLKSVVFTRSGSESFSVKGFRQGRGHAEVMYHDRNDPQAKDLFRPVFGE